MLKSSDIGVWVSIRGATIIQLYDKKTHQCKLVVDVQKNEILNLNKVSIFLSVFGIESFFNKIEFFHYITLS